MEMTAKSVLCFGSYWNEDGKFNSPQDVAVSKDNHIMISDNPRVKVFDSNGNFIYKFGNIDNNPFWCPVGIEINSKEQIIVVENYNKTVQVFDSTGQFVDFDDLSLISPQGIVVDDMDNMVITDYFRNGVRLFNSDCQLIREFGSELISRYPSGITINDQQNIIVTTANGVNYIFDHEGNFLHNSRSDETDTRFNYFRGITVDKSDKIFASYSYKIEAFDPDGTFLYEFGSIGYDKGQLNYPHGIAINDYQQIVVCDSGNHRIQVFDLDN